MINRFSSYTRLARTIAEYLRFVYNICSDPSLGNYDPITVQELETSRKIIVKRVQQRMFYKEIEAIKNQRSIARDSRLIGLNSFLDQEGLLRVGGRLKNSNLAYEAKHQLILSAQHGFTQLIIEHEHMKLLYAGSQATLGAV